MKIDITRLDNEHLHNIRSEVSKEIKKREDIINHDFKLYNVEYDEDDDGMILFYWRCKKCGAESDSNEYIGSMPAPDRDDNCSDRN